MSNNLVDEREYILIKGSFDAVQRAAVCFVLISYIKTCLFFLNGGGVILNVIIHCGRAFLYQYIYNIKGLKASSETFRNVREGILSQLTSTDGEIAKIRSIVEEGMVLKVGSGDSILFWHDKWCDVGPLKREFPRLFSISSQQNLFINQMGDWQVDGWVWNLLWRRRLYDWEVADFARLEAMIVMLPPQRVGSDDVFWQDSTKSEFPIQCLVG